MGLRQPLGHLFVEALRRREGELLLTSDVGGSDARSKSGSLSDLDAELCGMNASNVSEALVSLARLASAVIITF